MVGNTAATYLWMWMLSVAACADAVSFDTAMVGAHQSGDEKTRIVATMDKATATDDWVVFRLIDEDGRPVAGAKVGRNVGLDDPRLAGKQLAWSEAFTSDGNGQIAMPKESVFTWRGERPSLRTRVRPSGSWPSVSRGVGKSR
jgi:hypothetical protein